jgi:predicted amidohydrolase
VNTPPSTISITLWAANLEVPAVSLATWLDLVEARLAESRAAGSQLLVLPELNCIQWLGFAPAGLAVNRQPAWLADMAREVLPELRALVAKYGIALLAGTFPWALQTGGFANRAWLVLPDGRAFSQDKLFLTPGEQNPQAWQFTPGTQINVIEWLGLRVAMIICLDTEATALWARLAGLDLDLILIPAKTDALSGYYRVFSCARSRAIELQTMICVVGEVPVSLLDREKILD